MARETVAEKGARLLVDGRLWVQEVNARTIRAVCNGDNGAYEVVYADGAWACSCPARVDCAHLTALRAVTETPEPTP